MLQIFRSPKFDFMGFQKYGFVLSGIILLSSFVMLGMHKRATGDLLNYGIDFRGGTLMQVRFAAAPDVDSMRGALEKAGFGNASIQSFGKSAENSVLIRLSEQLEGSKDLVAKVRAALRTPSETQSEAAGLLDLNSVGEAQIAQVLEREITGNNEKSPDPKWATVAISVIAARGRTAEGRFTSIEDLRAIAELDSEMVAALGKTVYFGSASFQRTESVGPAVGRDLRGKALLASLIACGLILVYLWFRFELRFGVAAVICLMHDLIFIIGVFAFTRREFDLTVLAAILTVIGYSVNDTVVIFDRIRENLKLMRRAPLTEIINASVNSTLSRTVITSALTLLVVIAVFLYGGPVLNGFAFALILGIVEGTYSTIFVASPLLILWERYVAKSQSPAPVLTTR